MTGETSRSIPAEGWRAFFEELNRLYRGQRAVVEAQAAGREWRTVAGDEPFNGIAISDEEAGAAIIELGGLSYSAGVPQQVRVERAVGGQGQTITVVQADGSVTALHLAGGPLRSDPVGAADSDLTAVGGSAGAAGGSVAEGARPSGGRDTRDSSGGQISFGSSDDMGGVAAIPSGSLGDRDLSGRRRYDISADVYDGPALDPTTDAETHAGSGSETAASGAAPISTVQGGGAAVGQHHLHPDVIDGGSGQGVLDSGVDPIAGGPLRPGTDDNDDMVEGEVGAQAEGDLEERIRRDAERQERAKKTRPDSSGR